MRHTFKSIVSQDIAEWNIYAILNIFQMTVGVLFLPVRFIMLLIPNVLGWILVKLLTIDLKFPVNYCSVQLQPEMPLWRRNLMYTFMYWFY